LTDVYDHLRRSGALAAGSDLYTGTLELLVLKA
jgi:hypothetical protein